MPLKTVLLDVGDTLLHEVPTRPEIYAAVAAEFGARTDPRSTETWMRAASAALPRQVPGGFRYSDAWFDAFIERIFVGELGLAPGLLPDVTARLHERFSDPATFQLYPGAAALLEALRGCGLGVGIVSNWSARLPLLLERLGIAERVDFVLCSAIEECEKPEAEIFRRALERAGARPEQALHAGDHPELDVAAARAVGLEAVLVDHRGARRGAPGPRVESLFELLELVGERAA